MILFSEQFVDSIRSAVMAALLTQYFNIAFLMAKPQDLPAGSNQLTIALSLSFTSYVLASLTHYGFAQSVGTAFVDLALSGLLIYVALVALGRTERFYQAYGALAGAGAVLNTAAIPLFLVRSEEQASLTAGLADFVLLVWSLSLLAHVIRHTFEVRMLFSVVLAFCYFLFVVSLLSTLWPPDVTFESDELSNFQSLGYRWWESV
ncbi:MAG: hypothetical protein KTR35_05775 [Gammaproteobacteria bacterium]|nr:hypothetical protein [Gammaproteobacteria bacterium]